MAREEKESSLVGMHLTMEKDGSLRVLDFPEDYHTQNFAEHIEEVTSLLESHPDAEDFADLVQDIVKRLEALQDEVRGAIAAGW
jgi:ABC-type hemin transport system substrate-binding protein